jgi:GNAT superfamily N-acetyltransferase
MHADRLEAWISAVIDGFATPDSNNVPEHDDFPRHVLERVLRDMAGASGVLRYAATLDGEVAGAASMRLDGEIAQLSGSATRPAFRRRGVQSALLAARLAEAARSGCKIAVVTTQPGSTSHGTVHRAGFELLYVRAILRRDKA